MAVFTSGLSQMVRAMALALASFTAPSTTTFTSLVAPSPSRTI
jgi:hypothetical protein